jgi:hypothetical protein
MMFPVTRQFSFYIHSESQNNGGTTAQKKLHHPSSLLHGQLILIKLIIFIPFNYLNNLEKKSIKLFLIIEMLSRRQKYSWSLTALRAAVSASADDIDWRIKNYFTYFLSSGCYK